MVKDVGRLRVTLGLDNKAFKSGLSGSRADLKVFAARAAKIVAGLTVTAGAGLLALGNRARTEIDAQAKLAQSLQTTTSSIQVLARAGELAGVEMAGIEQATKDLTRRLSQAADGGGPAAEALDRLGLSATDLMEMPLDQRVSEINGAIEEFIPAAGQAAVAGKLFGEEGSIAMSRIDPDTLRQANEELARFGVLVSESEADQIERTNDAISQLGLITQGLGNQVAVATAPALERMADGIATLFERGSFLSNVITGLAANLDTIVMTAGIAAGAFGVKLVGGMAIAAAQTFTLRGAFVALRGAIISTGIGALIVGAGMLAAWFVRLSERVGGFGEAFSMVKDLASEVFERIGLRLLSFVNMGRARWSLFVSKLVEGLADVVDFVGGDWANKLIGAYKGVYDTGVAIWEQLPQAFDRIGKLAANAMIEGLATIVDAMTGFGPLMSAVGLPTIGGNIRSFKFDSPGDGGGGVDVAGIFGAAMSTDYTGKASSGLRGRAEELREGAAALKDLAEAQKEQAGDPLESWAAIAEVMSGAADEADRLASSSRDGAQSLGQVTEAASGKGGGGGAAEAVGAVGDAAEDTAATFDGPFAQAVDGISGAFGDFVARGFKGFKDFADAVKSEFSRLISTLVATAARNAILIPLGLAGGGAGGALSAVTGGGGGGLLSGIGGAFGTFTSGIGSGLSAALGTGGFASAGIFNIGANAATAAATGVGGLAATIGAALPVVGIVAGLFSLFRRKPPISKKDFAAIQSGLKLTGMELLDTGRKGQKAAANLKKLTGGMDEFEKLTESYFGNFFTEAEQRDVKIDSLTDVFDELDFAMPKTARGFRNLVESLDLTTKSGREAYAELLKASPVFADVFGGIGDALAPLDRVGGGGAFRTRVEEQLFRAALARGEEARFFQPGGGVVNATSLVGLAGAPGGEPVEEIAAGTIQTVSVLRRIERLFDEWDIRGLPGERTTA